MYFQNYSLLKRSLNKCLESPVSEHPSTVNMFKGLEELWNLHDSTFSYFIITLEDFELENDSLSDTWNRRTVFNTLIAYDKSFLCNSENLSQPINNNYLKNKKLFLEFLLPFFNLHQILNILQKRWDS